MFKFYREVLDIPWDVKHIPRPRKERSLPPVLSQQEVQKLIEHGAIFKHQVFMTLLYSTGLRLSEALNLRVEDIDGQYFSCGNSHCPQCQGIKRIQWQDRLAQRMLNVPYVPTTFTMPHQLNGLARHNTKAIYNLLFRSAWKTIKQLCADEGNVGALSGMTAVLHSWGSDLKYHVHAHCLITFGGMTSGPNPEWRWPHGKHKCALNTTIMPIKKRVSQRQRNTGICRRWWP